MELVLGLFSLAAVVGFFVLPPLTLYALINGLLALRERKGELREVTPPTAPKASSRPSQRRPQRKSRREEPPPPAADVVAAPESRWTYLRQAGAAFLLWLATAALVLPDFWRPRALPHLNACKSNLQNITTGCKSYSTDNGGHYPPSLSLLTPNYLKQLPECPGAYDDSYSKGYTSSTYSPDVAGSVDAYTVCCCGLHHSDAGITTPHYPQYSSYAGLLLP